MTVLVTGGAGFIGSNFIFHMMEAHPEDRIVCLDVRACWMPGACDS